MSRSWREARGLKVAQESDWSDGESELPSLETMLALWVTGWDKAK